MVLLFSHHECYSFLCGWTCRQRAWKLLAVDIGFPTKSHNFICFKICPIHFWVAEVEFGLYRQALSLRDPFLELLRTLCADGSWLTPSPAIPFSKALLPSQAILLKSGQKGVQEGPRGRTNCSNGASPSSHFYFLPSAQWRLRSTVVV